MNYPKITFTKVDDETFASWHVCADGICFGTIGRYDVDGRVDGYCATPVEHVCKYSVADDERWFSVVDYTSPAAALAAARRYCREFIANSPDAPSPADVAAVRRYLRRYSQTSACKR